MGDEDVDSGALALYNRMGRRMEKGFMYFHIQCLHLHKDGRTNERMQSAICSPSIDSPPYVLQTYQWLTIRVHSYSTPVPHLSGTWRADTVDSAIIIIIIIADNTNPVQGRGGKSVLTEDNNHHRSAEHHSTRSSERDDDGRPGYDRLHIFCNWSPRPTGMIWISCTRRHPRQLLSRGGGE